MLSTFGAYEISELLIYDHFSSYNFLYRVDKIYIRSVWFFWLKENERKIGKLKFRFHGEKEGDKDKGRSKDKNWIFMVVLWKKNWILSAGEKKFALAKINFSSRICKEK